MSVNRKHIIAAVVIGLGFVLKKYGYSIYDNTVPCEESNQYNDFCFNIIAFSEFLIAFGLNLGISRKGIVKPLSRIILVATAFATLNELVGLNEYLDPIQEPIFWTVMLITCVYSYVKYQK